ncbi:hypothetical protein [Paraburkholderia guartelaensis]|uniref:Uncharacterized protein n=1 Tax=Paraburkholderia guartelaensis TaxID=2546446 RepID=A0ABU9SBZ4_9BURK
MQTRNFARQLNDLILRLDQFSDIAKVSRTSFPKEAEKLLRSRGMPANAAQSTQALSDDTREASCPGSIQRLCASPTRQAPQKIATRSASREPANLTSVPTAMVARKRTSGQLFDAMLVTPDSSVCEPEFGPGCEATTFSVFANQTGPYMVPAESVVTLRLWTRYLSSLCPEDVGQHIEAWLAPELHRVIQPWDSALAENIRSVITFSHHWSDVYVRLRPRTPCNAAPRRQHTYEHENTPLSEGYALLQRAIAERSRERTRQRNNVPGEIRP